MKKTIIALSAIGMTLFSANVSAKTNDGFNAYTSKTEKRIERIQADIPDGNVLAAIYNSDGKLFSAMPAAIKDRECSIDIAYPDNNYTLRLYYNFGTDAFLELTGDETKYNTVNEQKPDKPDNETNKPDNSQNTDKPGKPDTNSTAAAKLGSVAVVKESGEEYDSDTDQTISYIDVLYNNKEIRIKLEDGYRISDASESLSYMKGKNVTELRAGDVLSLSANLSGRLNGIKLIFRAPETDPVANDGDKTLFDLTDDGEMFGLIQSKPNSQVIILYDGDGKFENAKEVDIEADTTVYFYDMSKKKDNLRIGTASEIFKSEIPSADYDDDENVIKWSDGCTHNYAFVKTYKDEVCSIVVYENYEM